MELHQLLDRVQDRASFFDFVRQLVLDREQAAKLEAANPSSPMVLMPADGRIHQLQRTLTLHWDGPKILRWELRRDFPLSRLGKNLQHFSTSAKSTNNTGGQPRDNNTLHTEPRAARLLETMAFAAAR